MKISINENGLEDLKNFENSEVPTIRLSEIRMLIKQMEDTLDIIANEDQYDGFDAAIYMVKRFFLVDRSSLYTFKKSTGITDNHKLTVLENDINTCYRYIDFIEDFLEKQDEEIGLGKNSLVKDYVDYDEAIAALRNCLHKIIKEIR